MPQKVGDVTRLLIAFSAGDRQALEELIPLIYGELRTLASAYLRREPAGHTLQTVDLLHEAYLRMIDQRQVAWHNRAHFFGIAAQMMRRILVDHARSRLAAKRGGRSPLLSLSQAPEIAAGEATELVALDDALAALAAIDPEQARVVEMRYFGGLTGDEIAVALGWSSRTVTRRWRMARAWLYQQLVAGDG